MHLNNNVSSRCVNALHDMSTSFQRMIQRRQSQKLLKEGKRTHLRVGYVMHLGTLGLSALRYDPQEKLINASSVTKARRSTKSGN